ncbi:protein SCO1 homolog, mitochondrial-like [Physella acuta]|uniref:protein SCO1 homolog, mitochondrial-like n=1 Tax=Physella acuta TaxID=109671 RepID=UPI0027DE8CFE|nr:protein SCO1 homolog, mitochondrial-like [Physella acuta]
MRWISRLQLFFFIIYMGFTHCPDICPEEMEKLGKIVKTFDENPDLPDLQPMFITLDPERDSPSVIKDYLKDFASPRIIGFTGTEDEIREIAKKFRAYFGKGPKDSDNDYIVDHTIITYLINPKGEFVNYFDRSVKAENIIKTVTEHIKKYNELEKRNLL